jgi:uncharacterized membrane protein YoaK (UPF0700 family)
VTSTSQNHGCIRLLFIPVVLSVTAGSADVTSFLGLGLFNAHITGNLVILAAHIVAKGRADPTLILSVPIFVLVLGLMKLLVAGLEAANIKSLRPLLLLQFLLLGGSFGICAFSSQSPNSNAMSLILAGQLGVAAMAVQNALVQLSLPGTPATAVMTSNVTRFVLDLGEVLLGRTPDGVAAARHRVKNTWPVIVGFFVGACLGAACFAYMGLDSLSLPAGIALLALAVSLVGNPGGRQPLNPVVNEVRRTNQR